MNKWNYIKKISAESDKYGDKLLELMKKYNKLSLKEITFEEAKEFWEELEKEWGNDYTKANKRVYKGVKL